MIAAVLKRAGSKSGLVGYARANMNDDKGLPLTVLQYDSWLSNFEVLKGGAFRAIWYTLFPSSYPKILVLEFGTHWDGHLERLTRLAPPNIGIVTIIGPAHLDRLKTLEGVVREKSAVVRAVPPEGLVILGEDHDYVAQLERSARAPVKRISGRGLMLSENIAREVCRYLEVPDHVIDSALNDFHRPKRRLNCFDLGPFKLIDDSISANPLSMKLGLDTLAVMGVQSKRRLAVLGCMAELGEQTPAFHREIGIYARCTADVVIGVGELARNYEPDYWFPSSEACSSEIAALLRFGDCLLVKGSASNRMRVVADRIKEIAEKATV
jgi:UDP-N-acetylmuramoyl-tripeptide--D-alanyl-D-alanine ligase